MHTRPLPAARVALPSGAVVPTRRPDGSLHAVVDVARERSHDATEFEGDVSR